MRAYRLRRVTLGEARATIDRYVRALSRGDFPNAQAAAAACRDDLTRRCRGRKVVTLRALTLQLRQDARLKQLAYAKARWNVEDSRVAERYARAVVAGEYQGVPLAAEACHLEMARALGTGRSTRPLSAVLAKLHELTRAMGLYKRPRWTEEERRVVNRYLRALYAGRFPHVKPAAEACAGEMQRRFGPGGRRDSGSAGRHTTGAVLQAMNGSFRRFGLPRFGCTFASLERQLFRKYARAVAEGRYVNALEAAADCRREVTRAYAPVGAQGPLHVRRLAPRSLIATQRSILKEVARLRIQYPGRRWLPAEMRIFNGWLRWYSRYHRVRRLEPLTQAANGLSEDLAMKGFRRTPRACEGRLLIMRRKMTRDD